MLKDITLGQYFPMPSPVHRLDARVKLVLAVLYIVTLFIANGIISYAVMVAFLAVIIAASKIKPRLILKSVKPLLFIIILTSVLNILYTPGSYIVDWGWLHISVEGIALAIKMSLRIIMLIIGTSMLTYTTSPIMLTDAMELLLAPLGYIKLPVHELSMMMSIALRFIPTLVDETEKIMNAQKSRGADFETGSIIRRAKALIPILVPLFVSAFRRADELAMAMESRCYQGGAGRTRLIRMKAGKTDIITLVSVCLLFAGVIALGVLGL